MGKSKRATVGDRIARDHERRITNDKTRDFHDPYLARRIDAAIRKAAWDGYGRGERAQKHWDKDRDKEWAAEQVSMEDNYGYRPQTRKRGTR